MQHSPNGDGGLAPDCALVLPGCIKEATIALADDAVPFDQEGRQVEARVAARVARVRHEQRLRLQEQQSIKAHEGFQFVTAGIDTLGLPIMSCKTVT